MPFTALGLNRHIVAAHADVRRAKELDSISWVITTNQVPYAPHNEHESLIGIALRALKSSDKHFLYAVVSLLAWMNDLHVQIKEKKTMTKEETTQAIFQAIQAYQKLEPNKSIAELVANVTGRSGTVSDEDLLKGIKGVVDNTRRTRLMVQISTMGLDKAEALLLSGHL